jgi:hypothetical protein
MWTSLLIYSIISFLTVYISHQLWGYIKNKYTVKKYLVGSQINKYKTMLKELQETPTPPPLVDDLKTDLEDFMKDL